MGCGLGKESSVINVVVANKNVLKPVKGTSQSFINDGCWILRGGRLLSTSNVRELFPGV